MPPKESILCKTHMRATLKCVIYPLAAAKDSNAWCGLGSNDSLLRFQWVLFKIKISSSQ